MASKKNPSIFATLQKTTESASAVNGEFTRQLPLASLLDNPMNRFSMAEDEEFQSVISQRVDSGVTVAVYYVDGDTEVLIPKKKLILPDFVEIEPNTDAEGGDYFFWLSFLAVGEGEITCADYPGCGLPVVSELPYIALYSQPEAEEEYLLDNKDLSLDFSEEEEDGRRYAISFPHRKTGP